MSTWISSQIYPASNWRSDLDEAFGLEFYKDIPQRMIPPLYAYVLEGQKPGHFLTAVLCNNLWMASFEADSENVKLLREWAMLVYNYTPYKCNGSKEAMDRWMLERQNARLVSERDERQPAV
jgi:hypothetical protein